MFKALEKKVSRRVFVESMAASLTVPSQSSFAMLATGTLSHRNSFHAQPKAVKNGHLTIGCLVYPRQDQIDFTGPFEVLSRIPNSMVYVIGKEKSSFRDVKHRKAVSDILGDLSKLNAKEAVKIPLSSLGGEKMQNLRSALNRVTREKNIPVLTSSDDKFFYVWRDDASKNTAASE
jgi:hypothetical protein